MSDDEVEFPSESRPSRRGISWRFRPLLAVALALLAYRALPSTPPANLGVVGGRLADCPGSPNCVSSQAGDPAHRVEPIPFEGPPAAAARTIKKALARLPRTVVVAEAHGYVRAEATSLVFGFVDDLEFLADSGAGLIQVRSASRVGQSDLGVNRNRLARFREAFVRDRREPNDSR